MSKEISSPCCMLYLTPNKMCTSSAQQPSTRLSPQYQHKPLSYCMHSNFSAPTHDAHAARLSLLANGQVLEVCLKALHVLHLRRHHSSQCHYQCKGMAGHAAQRTLEALGLCCATTTSC